MPHKYLKNIDLIDTPGLFSTKKDDSANTIELFKDNSRCPDIILFLSQKEYKKEDIEAVSSFQNSNSYKKNKINGLNTITAFSHSDNLNGGNWAVDYQEEAKRMIENNRRKYPEFRSCFSRAFAIAALYAQSSYALTNADFNILKGISKENIAEKFYNRYNKKRYLNTEKDKDVWDKYFNSDEEKVAMLYRLELEVMQYSVWWLSNNPHANLMDLKQALIDYSGVPIMEHYIFQEHFGKLSMFYKAIRIIPGLRKLIERKIPYCIDARNKEILVKSLSLCVNMEKELYSEFSYLSVLYDYYNSESYFTEEEWEEALKSIQLCMSDDYSSEDITNAQEYWNKKNMYFKLIYDTTAMEVSGLLINSLNRL